MLQPHKKQEEVIRSPARYKVIRAGRKGGKTALEVESIVYMAVVSAKKLNLTKTTFQTGRKIIYIAPTQTQARDIVWSSFRNRLGTIGKFNEKRLEIQLPNEDGEVTTIMIGGWENRENYRGLADVIHITFDEVDTLKDFFISYQDIFRPMFLDTGGTADFIGTPKKENPNLKRLEKNAEIDPNYECFHFTSKDNPYLSPKEIEEIEQEYKDNRDSYRQEILAEYVENTGALFKYSALVDIFSNTIDKTNQKYLIIDVGGDGLDKTVFSFWEGLEEYKRESFVRMSKNALREKIREYIAQDRIPMSNVLIDTIGVGDGLDSEPLLDGIVGFKSSYSAIKTDIDLVKLPNVHYRKEAPLTTEYRNLRSQCVFTLSDRVNNHQIASRVQGEAKERVIEELSLYQDTSKGDGKRQVTSKEDIKVLLGRSPDESDCFVAGTQVLTVSGNKNIEDIKKGELIITPFGQARVNEVICKNTDTLYTLDNKLTGTGNHKLFSGSGFSTLDTYNMRVYNYYIGNKYNNFIWKILSSLSTKIKNTGFRVLVNTSTIAHTKEGLDREELHYIDKSGKITTKWKFLKNAMYIILTGILLITTRLIWLVLMGLNIICTTVKSTIQKILTKLWKILRKRDLKQVNGIKANKVETGTLQCQKTLGSINKKQKGLVRIVKRLFLPLTQGLIAVIVVFKSIITELVNITKIENVSFVEMLLVSGSLNQPKLAHALVVSKVENTKVYTLNLDKHYVYMANDILVANCFVMRMFFEIKEKMLPQKSEEQMQILARQANQFMQRRNQHSQNGTK